MNNLIINNLPRYAPEVDPHQVLLVGAGGLQDAFSGETLQGVRQAFVDGLKGAWALGVALFCVSFFCAFIAKWPGRMMPEIAAKDAKDEGQSSDAVEKTIPVEV